MFKYILKFHKKDRAIYCSHLDTVRAFGRALRRAGIDISYSLGFNPHILMTFAQPLALGIASDCEYVEITANSVLDKKDTLKSLNDTLPGGFFFESIEQNEKKSPFAKLFKAEYTIVVDGEIPNTAVLKDFFRIDEIVVAKRSKSGTKNTDIKNMIYELETLSQTEKALKFRAIISSGDTNLKPDLLITAIEKYTENLKVEDYTILRTALLDKEGKPLII